MDPQQTQTSQEHNEDDKIPAFMRTFKKAEQLRVIPITPVKSEISPSELFLRSFMSQSKEENERSEPSEDQQGSIKRRRSLSLDEEEDDDEDDPVAERQRPQCGICNIKTGT